MNEEFEKAALVRDEIRLLDQKLERKLVGEGNNMSLDTFLNQAVSSWMSVEGPDSDIVLSSRIRLARNMDQFKFPFAYFK